MHCVYYLQGDINNMEDILSKYYGACLKQYGKGKRPHPQDYRPKLDITNELYADGIIRYQQFI